MFGSLFEHISELFGKPLQKHDEMCWKLLFSQLFLVNKLYDHVVTS